MKKCGILLLTAALLLSLTACGTPAGPTASEAPPQTSSVPTVTEASSEASSEATTEAPTEVPTEPPAPGLGRRLAGIYSAPAPNDEIFYVHVEPRGGMLVLEYSLICPGAEAPYDFWAGEFWPDDPQVLESPDALQITGKLATYSVITSMGTYHRLAAETTLSLTNLGLELADPDGRTQLIRDPQPALNHTSPFILEERLLHSYEDSGDRSAAGSWCCSTSGLAACLTLQPDGNAEAVIKTPGQPLWLWQGVWITDQDSGDLCLLGEAWGSGDLTYSLRFRQDGAALTPLGEEPLIRLPLSRSESWQIPQSMWYLQNSVRFTD